MKTSTGPNIDVSKDANHPDIIITRAMMDAGEEAGDNGYDFYVPTRDIEDIYVAMERAKALGV